MTDITTSQVHTKTSIDTVAHWTLRFAVSSVFLFHGVGKFGDLAGGAERFGVLYGLWVVVALTEVIAPILLIAGGFIRSNLGDLLTRFGALSMVGIQIGSIYLVHWGQWSFAASDNYPLGGMEFPVVLLMIQLYLLVKGNRA